MVARRFRELHAKAVLVEVAFLGLLWQLQDCRHAWQHSVDHGTKRAAPPFVARLGEDVWGEAGAMVIDALLPCVALAAEPADGLVILFTLVPVPVPRWLRREQGILHCEGAPAGKRASERN